MVVRTKKKTSVRKPAAKKKSARKVAADTPVNKKIHLEAYKELEKNLKGTWQKLRKSYMKGDVKAIQQDCDALRLFLGECNYMAGEYKKAMKAPGKKER